ncbi:MAG TPA: hypothetical protein VKG26_03955 [Bacteroidia bacterium]|nr:hypothetical protein [Bacteroidia bacterium]
MKIVKIAAFALCMASASLLNAQESELKKIGIEEKVKTETTELVQKLGLNATQEKTVSTAVLQRAKQMETDKEKYKDDKEGLKAAKKTSNQTFENSVKGVLTTDQKTKFEQMLKEKL